MMKRPAFFYPAAALLAGTGMLLSRRNPRMAALAATGSVACLGVAVLADRQGSGHTHSVTYEPVDTPKALADGLWIVDSGPLHGAIPLRMTVIRLADGGLLLHSPTRLTPALRTALEKLGPVQALIAPNLVHWMFLPEWQRAFPDAQTWAVPGLRHRAQVKKAGVVVDYDLSGTPPFAWRGLLDQITVPGGFGFNEVAFFHNPSRTLVLTDLVLNLEANRLPAVIRPLARLLGVTAPDGRAPFYVRAIVRSGGWAARNAAARILQLNPSRVVFAHGRMFEGDAASALVRSLSWLVPARKETP